MPVPKQLTVELHETNCRLRALLENVSSGCAPPAQGQRAATPEQMSGLLHELQLVHKLLEARPQQIEEGLEGEMSEYRILVEWLRDLLPSIHNVLVSERGRLELQCKRIRTASDWTRSSQQTLQSR